MNTVQEPLTGPIPPFPFFTENPAELNRAELPANKASINSNLSSVEIDTNQLPERCQFFFSDGRQCRMPRSEIHPSLCRFHAEREDQLFGEPGHSCVVGAALDLPELHSACRDLTTAAGVTRALAQVFRLLAQRRISRQEAATFGHLAQLLLRSISAARAESDHPTGTPDQVVERQKDVVITSLLPQKEVPVVERQKGVGITPLLAHKKVESERGSDCAPRMPSWRMAPDSSPVNGGAPVGRAKVYPQDELLRVNKVQAAPAPNSQGPQNEHFDKPHLQLTQNEHLPDFST